MDFSRRKTVLFLSLAVFSFALVLFLSHTLAQDGNGGGNGNGNGEGEDGEEECIPCYSEWYECRGTSSPSCNGELWLVWQESCCDGSGEYLIQNCQPWQRCDAGAGTCSCDGNCLETPQNPRYYDNPTYSDQPDKDVEDVNVKLPVKLDWDDVLGWGQEDGPQSYRINIENTNDSFPKTVTESEFIPDSCVLKSNATHPWQTQACCTTGGQNCGPQSNWNFSTSLAPEPISPYDPDWQGTEKVAENLFPFFEWCPVEDARSYFLTIYEKEGNEFKLLLPERVIVPLTHYDDDRGWQELKTGTSYGWQVAQCPEIDTPQEECSIFSQFWGVLIGEELAIPTRLRPEDMSAVNLLTRLSWLGNRYATGYLLHIQGGGISEEFPVTGFAEFPLESIWEEWLELDTPYSWKVASCKGSEDELVCTDEETGEINWSETITFRTTGAPPTNLTFEPVNEAGEIGFPLTVLWDDVPGAASYVFDLIGMDSSEIVSRAAKTLDFSPDFKQGETYAVSIKTCADTEDELCGQEAIASFRVATLQPPAISAPAEPKPAPTVGASWDAVFGANAYEYQLVYLSLGAEETRDFCANLLSQGGIVDEKSFTTQTSKALQTRCFGEYELAVRGCIAQENDSCLEPGSWARQRFTVFPPLEPSLWGGLIPCGQATPNPGTPWDETDPCELKHVFILLQTLLNFAILWVIPIALALLAVASGVIFYFSAKMEAPDPIAKVKSLWRAAGIGLIIIFSAWFIVSLFLTIFGYQVGVFGPWWQIF